MDVVLVAVFAPSFTVSVTVYVPAVSNTCAATGPLAVFLEAAVCEPFAHTPLVPTTTSPKLQEYSKSWNGRAAIALTPVVAVASKKTANGATPEVRAATNEVAGAAGAPPPLPQETRPSVENSAAKEIPKKILNMKDLLFSMVASLQKFRLGNSICTFTPVVLGSIERYASEHNTPSPFDVNMLARRRRGGDER